MMPAFIRCSKIRCLRAVPSLWLVISSGVGWSHAAVDFTNDIRPVLAAACFDCHDGEQQKSKLRLDEVVGILRGGDSGEPIFVPRNSNESSLIKRVTSENPKERMPPKGDRLTAEQIALLRAWIDEGAQMPGAAEAAESLSIKTDHWSFQPVQRPAVPAHGDAAGQNEIDAFVLAKLNSQQLALSAPADRPTLIRRLYLIMHGLPPTPAEVAQFVNDARPDAYARLVETVLASPRYGERWARHWMDVVRYADTNGFETNRPRPTAWQYRDWIVASLNADKPYDLFIREQIAGDVLGADAATGFLVAGAVDIVKGDPALNAMQRQDELADMVSTTATAFMGLTLGCARCHNHKFDPILQKDYYAMQAVFAGVSHGERTLLQTPDPATTEALANAKAAEAELLAELEIFKTQARSAVSPGTTLRPAVKARMNEETFPPVETQSVRFTIHACSAAEPCLDELEIYDGAGVNVALASAGAKPSASGTLSGNAIHKLAHLNDGQLGNQHSWISNRGTGWVRIDFSTKQSIQRIVWGRDRLGKFQDRVATKYEIEAATGPDQWSLIASSADREPFNSAESADAFLEHLAPADADAARKVQAELAKARSQLATLENAQKGWVGIFTQPAPTRRLYRGEVSQPREIVAPDSLTVLGSLQMSASEPESQRRLKLANSIASAAHPLTARVMVNRVWHYIFGHGIVDTPSDFGKNGALPTHPELLDWLADEFIRKGWSLKALQRTILLSAAFQQGSAPRSDGLRADTSGHTLWRFTPRRMEAEAIRDSILAVSGALDIKMGGPGFSLMDIVEENVMHYFPKEQFTAAEFRRMVYQFRIRQTTDSVFSSFDCPDGGQVIARRTRSNTPLQALNLFNSNFVLQQSLLLSERLQQEVGDSPEAQVERAFLLCFARPPDAWEMQTSADLIRAQDLPSFGRAMFNTSEFLFVF